MIEISVFFVICLGVVSLTYWIAYQMVNSLIDRIMGRMDDLIDGWLLKIGKKHMDFEFIPGETIEVEELGDERTKMKRGVSTCVAWKSGLIAFNEKPKQYVVDERTVKYEDEKYIITMEAKGDA